MAARRTQILVMSALHRASRNATEPQAILEMPRIAAYNRSSGLLLFFTRTLGKSRPHHVCDNRLRQVHALGELVG